MNAGDKFTFEGKEYFFVQDSKRNGGGSHFFAQEIGKANIAMRQIAYADFIKSEAKEKSLNVRFVAFMMLSGCQEKRTTVRNGLFMAWIAKAVTAFAHTKGFTHTPANPYHIQNQDEFTDFIIAHGKDITTKGHHSPTLR